MRTFAGIPKEYGELYSSKIVLIPAPFDGTSTWKKGSERGVEAMLRASENMELYDLETRSEVYRKGIFTAPAACQPEDAPEDMVEKVYRAVGSFIERKKFVTLFGGEHSVSIGSIRAFSERYPKQFSVLQIDAHADLRRTYEGSPFNHACAMYEARQRDRLVQVGIRSVAADERKWMKRKNVFFAQDICGRKKWIRSALSRLKKNVYITLDLDALDPSVMPATGTPEPGGFRYEELLYFLREVFKSKRVVGFDMVELCPNENLYHADFTAAKIYYKMLSYKFYGT